MRVENIQSVDMASIMRNADHRIQVRTEIAVLKRVSSGHKNIITMHDYFEVRHIEPFTHDLVN
jgi:hypothetical protein